MTFSDAELDALIALPKTITDPPRKGMVDAGGHRRNDFKCQAVEGEQRFRVFMRQNSTFPDSFSIGLAFLLPEGGEVILLRCNGPHGEVVSDPMEGSADPHYGFHVHRATEDNMAKGRSPEAGADLTTEYGTFEDALAYFVKRCGITDAEVFFPALGNPTLF